MKMKALLCLVFGILFNVSSGLTQEKRSLTPDDLPGWKRLGSAKISNNGAWVSYVVKPNVGDGILHVKNPDLGIDTTFERGYKAQFSAENNYIVFMIKPQLDSLRKMKIAEVPKLKWPSDTLAIYVFDQDTLMKFEGVKSYKMASEGSDWLSFHYKKPQKEKTVPNGKKKKKKKKVKKGSEPKSTKKPIKRKTSDLVIFNPVSGEKKQLKNVIEYTISEYGNSTGYIRSFGDTIDSTGVYWFNNSTGVMDTSFVGLGNSKKPTFNESGDEFVWLLSADTGKAKAFSMYSTKGNQGTRILIDTNDRFLPKGHTVSENGRIYFSKDGSKIFFGTALRPLEEPKDSISNEEKSTLDVWSWTDIEIQPMQLLNKAKEEKKTYLAVFHLNAQKVVPLGNDSTGGIRPLIDGDSRYAVLTQSKAYDLSTSWTFPFLSDYYRLNVITGEKELIKKAVGYNTSMSPSGRYFAYFNGKESAWYCIDMETKIDVLISQQLTNQNQIIANLESEIPAKPFAIGMYGWVESEEWMLIKTKYDIWKVDPKGVKSPVSLTNGKADQEKWKVNIRNFDRDLEYVNLDSIVMISVQNIVTNEAGLFLRDPVNGNVTELTYGKQSIYQVVRAKEVNRFFYRPASFETYPDLVYTKISEGNSITKQFQNTVKISNALPEQKEVLWGSVTQHFWKDENGLEQKGLLYYPENFDSTKQYPVMIYFYEKYFSSEFSYRSFRPSHSTVAVPLYTSNGYLVLIPDIHYGTGHPGKDGLNAVVSGANSLKKLPYVNGAKMAIQGQSWGGYQVAYIVTQTNMFAAAMAGAPVSNMTSAYGGIRWGSGMSREFQYERTQSRIGQNLWDGHDLYIENSPVFHLPKVTTPLLIMHNDKDGAVPYYQGIEMFMGMRRLQKPAWLLVYNNEQHNLRKMPNRLDLSRRMYQFFNFYLKDGPMPKWMKEGVPAIDKGKDYGFEVVPNK
ncbi:MAG: dipeptidyl aminopeptidase/acylaminoacyl peptidase [Salibacteraceae bacterium]|jgi:dipeptidyl aminopeptidase/acylaminoacyl peptidase